MKVSIIMPTYNDASHIASSIQSVIEQTYRNWELLIMDDGSKDNTHDVVKAINDSRIHYFKQKNKGQLVALNNLCRYITGDVVLMLHSDDSLYCNNALETNLKNFEDSEIDGIYGDLHQFFDSGKPDEVVLAPSQMNQRAVYRLLILLGSNIIFDHFFVRRSVFEQNVKYNYFTYYMPYWLDFSNNTVTSLNLKYTSSPWYHYRVYDQNYTNSVIGNFEVYFTRFRSIFFLSQYFTVPFPLLEKELMRRFKILGPIIKRKSSKQQLASLYRANIRSMKNRTENAFTDYFERLVNFCEITSERSIIFKSPIEILYKSSEARKFYNDLKDSCLNPLIVEIFKEMELGFSCVIVNSDEEKHNLNELFKFLCIRSEIEVSKFQKQE